MAYGIKYRLEFTDIQQDEWEVQILEDDYAGAISAMIPSGTPLTIEWLTAGDDLTLGPVKGSMATINVECTTNFEYISLYDEEDLVRPVNVYKNEVLYWTGWLSNEYTEPYDSVPYTVSITAADGLGILKNIPYKNAGADYTGRVTADSIIKIILGHLGHEDYIEYCNVYEDRMSDGTTDSLFDQEYIDNDVFLDADCYSALSAILSKLNAVIRQWGGKFIIYRPAELINTTVYGRAMITGSVVGVTLSPDKVLDRDAMDLIDFNGGVLMLQAPMSMFTATQDYGTKESWIKNHTFDISTWQGYLAGNARFTHWVNSTAVAPISHYSQASGELQGVFLPGGGLIAQTFGTYAKVCTDEMILSFDYLIVNLTAGVVASQDVSIQLQDNTGAYWLTNGASPQTAIWTNVDYSTVTITDTDVPVGVGGWKTAMFRFTGLPIDGPYSIFLVGISDANVDVAYKNVRFYATSDEIVTSNKEKVKKRWWDFIVGNNYVLGKYLYNLATQSRYVDVEEVTERIYEVDNAIQGALGAQEYILGDCENTDIVNVMEQFKGSLAINQAGSLVQTAIDFVNMHAASYLAYGSVLTSTGNILRFTASVPGVDFAGGTTITNLTGNLAGTVANVTANTTGSNQVETITLSGGGGGTTAEVSFYGIGYTVTYNSSLTQTATDFVTAWAVDLVSFNITLSSSGEDIIFTETAKMGGFTAPTITSGALTGTVYHTTPAAPAVARVDEITLTGSSGTANVVCDGVSTTATYNTDAIIAHTASWHTRGGSEAQPLIEIVADEVADMYSRGRHFIQMSLYELSESLDITKNLQDPLNKVGANNRVFAFNRGSLDCQMREWTSDYIEIGNK